MGQFNDIIPFQSFPFLSLFSSGTFSIRVHKIPRSSAELIFLEACPLITVIWLKPGSQKIVKGNP
jgi:hypothetical protein